MLSSLVEETSSGDPPATKRGMIAFLSRGADAFEGIHRATADHVGMLATIMNAICLHSMLENFGVESRLQTAIEIKVHQFNQ